MLPKIVTNQWLSVVEMCRSDGGLRGWLETESEKELTTHRLHDVNTLVQKARDLHLPASPEWSFFTPLTTKAQTSQPSKRMRHRFGNFAAKNTSHIGKIKKPGS